MHVPINPTLSQAFSYFLAPWDITGLPCVYPALVWNQPLLQEAWSLYWTMVLEIKIRGLDVLMTIGVFLLLGPPSGQS